MKKIIIAIFLFSVINVYPSTPPLKGKIVNCVANSDVEILNDLQSHSTLLANTDYWHMTFETVYDDGKMFQIPVTIRDRSGAVCKGYIAAKKLSFKKNKCKIIFADMACALE